MKALPTLLSVVLTLLLGLTVVACGNTNKQVGLISHNETGASTRTSSATLDGHIRKLDRDGDEDNNDDDAKTFSYGQAASSSDRRALTVLVTSYYHAAAAEDGVRACALLYPFVAESIPEHYGRSGTLRGQSCAIVLSKLFKQHRPLFVHEGTTVKVILTRVAGDKALAVLLFGTTPIHGITARRDGKTWKLVEIGYELVE
jgi:hypothetical protein